MIIRPSIVSRSKEFLMIEQKVEFGEFVGSPLVVFFLFGVVLMEGLQRLKPPLTESTCGDTVDAFGFTVSARVRQGAPWKGRHDKLADRIVQMTVT